MISRLKGTLIEKAEGSIEIETRGGVVYQVDVPLTVFEKLPGSGAEVEVRTAQIVSESSVALYGFRTARERTLFGRLLSINGVGARLALAMLSTYTADRLARALMEKDTTALRQVSGVGRKTAERACIELADKVSDLVDATDEGEGGGGGQGAQAAVQALIALGYTYADADAAVRRALEDGTDAASDVLIRKALSYR